MSVSILTGDCLDVLATLPAATFQTCVTSPPYYGLRDYGVDGQIGLDATPDEYIARMVDVFRVVRRVLRDDGTLWLNIGDSYNNFRTQMGPGQALHGRDELRGKIAPDDRKRGWAGAKEKDLLGIPWMLAFALRADGWFLRSAIVWAKPNPMPESVTDRPTSSYEHVFLLSKQARYFFDCAAIAEPSEYPGDKRHLRTDTRKAVDIMCDDGGSRARTGNATGATRNARNVWVIPTSPTPLAHFATMPPDLAERCIKAGSRPGDHVLDPFGGAGTTGLVADRLGRHATLCELNSEYAQMARERITSDAPLFASVA